jgi:uncharacterized coiled-coil protein SlyX
MSTFDYIVKRHFLGTNPNVPSDGIDYEQEWKLQERVIEEQNRRLAANQATVNEWTERLNRIEAKLDQLLAIHAKSDHATDSSRKGKNLPATDSQA